MKKHTLFVVLLFFCSTLALAPTPKQIIQKVIDNDRADSEKSQMKMTLINKRNQERVREVLAWSKKKDKNNDKKVIKFLSPADIRGSGLLTIEFSDREDDQWLYLPALKRDRRISSKKKSKSFMGTDFTYADFTTLDIDAYTYKELRKEKIGNVLCAVIEVVPKTQEKKEETGYSKMIQWVDESTNTTPQVKFFDKKDRFFKILNNEGLQKIGKKYRWKKMVMKNVLKEHTTILEFKSRELNKKLEDSIFTRRFLKRGV